jgi:hypothetical protein
MRSAWDQPIRVPEDELGWLASLGHSEAAHRWATSTGATKCCSSAARRYAGEAAEQSSAFRGMKLLLGGRVGVGVYGRRTWDRGFWENACWAGRYSSIGCEPELFIGRPCDLPGCAASANPSLSFAHRFS